MNRTLTAAAAALATLTTFAAASGAHAASATVRLSDLDLASAEGQAQLDARFNRAAREVCAITVVGSRIPRTDGECLTKARANFETQVAAIRSTSRNGG